MKIVAIVQARMGSKRLPMKMSMEIGGFPLIDWVLRRTKESKIITKIVLATSVREENNYLVDRARMVGVDYFQGDEKNVLSRFESIVLIEKPDYIVRICGDNPLITGTEIDRCVEFCINGDYDYTFNHIPAMGNLYVDGVGTEVMTIKTFNRIIKNARTSDHFEHVTKYIFENWDDFKAITFSAPKELAYPDFSLDVDTYDDFETIKDNIYSFFQKSHFLKPENLDVKEFVSFLVKNKVFKEI
jgi:spore coat polysaccharide biosynthesis protein SpsF